MKSSQELPRHHSIGAIQGTQNQKEKLDSYILNSVAIFVAALLTMVAFIILTVTDAGSKLAENYTVINSLAEFLLTFKGFPLLALFIPLIGGPLEVYLGRKSDNLRDTTVVDTSFVTLLVVLAMYPQAMAGTLRFYVPRILGFGLYFRVDMLSFTVMTITSILWLLVMIYSHDYMQFENHRNRFYLFMSITHGAILGTVMAGDIFTMFLFFEAMTFSSYMLVSHCEKKECIEAGNNYIYMGVMGGLSILFGMILLYLNINTLEFLPLASKLQSLGAMKYWIIGLFIFGFGIKAGMVPVHIWLPKAHPVAPTPASALLSGIMIKIGAYGILRVTTSFFFPLPGEIEGYKDILWNASKSLGAVIIWLGIVTMALGVFLALQQSNIKRMLAYHSISQMGYIILGIGVAAYLGHKGAMGFAGSVYHIINHALFKSVLFMAAGVIYLKTHELDMYQLGGFWRIMPFTAAATLVAALGITGVPGFNGFASKSILHHGIIEAYEYGHWSFKYAEIAFNIISAGTVCSFIKLFGFVFLGKLPDRYKELKGSYPIMDMAMGGLGLLIIGIGLRPNYVLDKFIIPAAQGITFDHHFIESHLMHMNFFNAHDMLGMVWVYLMGAVIFYLGIKFNLFHLHLPHWLKVEYILVYPLKKLVHLTCKVVSKKEQRALEKGDAIEEIGDALCAIIEHQEEEAEKNPGFLQRLLRIIGIFTDRYEMSLIRSDVVIYAIILTGILATLIFFG